MRRRARDVVDVVDLNAEVVRQFVGVLLKRDEILALAIVFGVILTLSLRSLMPETLAQLLKEAVRRQAGRRLLDAANRIQAAGIPPMSDEEIIAEVKAVRAERRARQAKADNANRS